MQHDSTFSLFYNYTESIEYIQSPSHTTIIPDNLIGKFGKIKFILLNRESICYLVTEFDDLFIRRFGSSSSSWERHVLHFKYSNERIVKISASYHAIVILLQSSSDSSRVFVYQIREYESDDYLFGELRGIVNVNVEQLDHIPTINTIEHWYRIKDFDSILKNGEYITNISCAAFTCCFVTSLGRLMACGCNQFGEIAQPKISNQTNCNVYNIEKIQECCLDPNNTCKNPFFIKTVNGDHDIYALTMDHEIFYCGYSLGRKHSDLRMLRQLQKINSMQKDEYFIDIAASYYGKLYLTNKFNIYKDDVLYGNLSNKIEEDIVSCQISASNSVYILIVNNSIVCSLDDNVFEIIHRVEKSSQSPFSSIISSKSHLLSTVSPQTCIIYWEYSRESKNLKEQEENLKQRALDGLISDILIIYY